MTNKVSLKIVLAAVVFILTITMVTGMLFLKAIFASGEDGLPAAADITALEEKGYTGLLEIEELKNNIRIINHREGYCLSLPNDAGESIKYDGNRLMVDYGDRVYEVYFEKFSGKEEVASYRSYSNTFMKNKNDHKNCSVKYYKSKGRDVQLSAWSREKLARIESDKNYYLCADVAFDDFCVLTVMGKFDKEASYEDELKSVVESIERLSEGDKKGIREHWDESTGLVYENYFGENSGLDWGVFKWGIDENWSLLTQLEDRIDYSFDILLYYSHFDSENTLERIERVVKSAAEEGRTVELTLQTKYSEEGNMIYDILNGEYDEFLKAYASLLNEMKVPVMFRLCNEMNGDWCEYSAFHTSRDAELFKEMYRYIYEIFMEEGAGAYTIWIWNPNEKSFPDYKWNSEFAYYPGDEYVDVVGITGYNTGTYYEGEIWRGFDEIYQPIYKKAMESFDKPLMITEFSCSSTGGDKQAWISDMFDSISNYEGIKAAVWWDGCDYDKEGNVARSYLIEENDRVINCFAKGLEKYN